MRAEKFEIAAGSISIELTCMPPRDAAQHGRAFVVSEIVSGLGAQMSQHFLQRVLVFRIVSLARGGRYLRAVSRFP